jgi:hypothetical protein
MKQITQGCDMLDFIRDIYTSFRQTSIERVKSPYLGAFVFSWIGFNWQMLAILLLSKKGVEERIELINKNFDIGDYLLGPIITAGLIAIILPQINKLITKVQDKPNIETITLSLNSKIEIAELQQALAESEARKKLAEKKEERFIEDGIHAIKNELEQTKGQLSERNKDVEFLRDIRTDLEGRLAKAESQLNVEKDARIQNQNDLNVERENNRAISDKLLGVTATLKKYQEELASSKESLKTSDETNNQLKGSFDYLTGSIDSIKEKYPNILRTHNVKGRTLYSINRKARPLLVDVNEYLEREIEREELERLQFLRNIKS